MFTEKVFEMYTPPPHSRILIAVSGGVDSMTLLDIYCQLRDERQDFELSAVHIHHGLRSESDKEEKLVQDYCKQKSIKLFLKHLKPVPEKENIEKWAHEERYRCFFEIADQNQCDAILLAHHANDRLETFLMYMLRGAGLHGLSYAMQFQQGLIYRPFYYIQKREIYAYAHANGIPYKEDKSNSDITFSRNRIRHSLSEGIASYSTDSFQNVIKTIDYLQESQKVLERLLSEKIRELSVESGLDRRKLASLPYAERKLLLQHWILQEHDLRSISHHVLEKMTQLVDAPSSKIQKLRVNKVLWVFMSQDRIYLKENPFSKESFLPYALRWNTDEVCILPYQLGRLRITQDLTLHDQENIIGCGRGHLPKQLQIRTRLAEDRIYLPKVGHKKLKKIFQEQKVPSHLRKICPIIEYNGSIIAIGIKDIVPSYGVEDAKWYLILESEKLTVGGSDE